MYQRYYKQRKFGRFFSFFLVIGSGVTHYVKSNYRAIKNSIKIENLVKYEEYLPGNTRSLLMNFQAIKNEDKINQAKLNELIYGKKESELEKFVKNNKWVFRNNFDNKNIRNFKLENISSYKDDIKLIETYRFYKKIR